MNERRLSADPVDPVDPMPPALVPPRSVLSGSRVRLEPLCASVHADTLYRACHGDDAAERVWTYLPYGPFPDRSSFSACLRACSGNLDPVCYAIHEWPPVRRNLEGWLAADNFDPTGRQRSSLASFHQVERKLGEEPAGGR